MDYSSLKTSTLEKRLAGAAEGSAEQRALQEELRKREPSRRPDTETLELFPAEQPLDWKRGAR